ncbi:uncharacterized protein [Dermacentor albipictus]|uniref:uncharacterized protein isoform X5 n=1 Tax=Dermacentor albipictus TaxID=60249 RepID=UPI0031FC8793
MMVCLYVDSGRKFVGNINRPSGVIEPRLSMLHEQERKQLTYCAKKHFESILRNLSVKVTQKIIQDVLRRENVRTGCRDPKVISAIEMKVFLNFTTNMRNRDLKVLRNGLMKGKTMLQFSDCFTRLYE